MKNSKKYAQKIQKLYRSLKRKYSKVEKPVYEDPAEALVYAVIAEHTSQKEADAAVKRFSEYFVDLNDLRVSRNEEIVEMLGRDDTTTRQVASRLTQILRAVFNQYHKVSLEALKKMGKRPAKSTLEKLDGTTRFIVNYCMLAALQAHAIPLTATMIQYLKDNELVHPDADEADVEGFLGKQVAAKNGYEFYALLRRESETASSAKRTKQPKTKRKTKPKAEPKTKTKVKTKKKTTKKKTAQKKTRKKRKV